MAKQTWLDQLNRYVFPTAVVLIGLYGLWDLIILPFAKFETPIEACITPVGEVAMLKPSLQPKQPPKRVKAPEGLPIVVPAGEKRILTVTVDNPTEKSVVYQWKAKYGRFESRVSMENQSVYIAPRSLINDTLTVEVSLQGCSAATRTVEVAVVPSASVPSADQPLPTPSAEVPTPPWPPSTLPTIEPTGSPSPQGR